MLASLTIATRLLLLIISEDFGVGNLKPVVVGPHYLGADLQT